LGGFLRTKGFVSVLSRPDLEVYDDGQISDIFQIAMISVRTNFRSRHSEYFKRDGGITLGLAEEILYNRAYRGREPVGKIKETLQLKLDAGLEELLMLEYDLDTSVVSYTVDEPDTSNNGSLDGHVGDDVPYEGVESVIARDLGAVVAQKPLGASPSPVPEFVDPLDYTSFPEYKALTKDQLDTPVRIGIIGDALFESNRFKQADFRKENSEIFQKEGNSWQAPLGEAIRALYPTREDLRALLRLVIPSISLPDYDLSQVPTDSDYTGISKNLLSRSYPNLFTGNVIENFRKERYPLRITEYLLDLSGNIASPIVLLRLQDRRVLVSENGRYSGDDLVIYVFKMRYGQFFEKLNYTGANNTELLNAAYQDAPDINRTRSVAILSAPVPQTEVISAAPVPQAEVIPKVYYDNNNPYEKLLETHFPEDIVASRLVQELLKGHIDKTYAENKLPKNIGSTFAAIQKTLEALADSDIILRNMKERRYEINPNPPAL